MKFHSVSLFMVLISPIFKPYFSRLVMSCLSSNFRDVVLDVVGYVVIWHSWADASEHPLCIN